MSELWQLSATELARRIAKHELSSREAAEAIEARLGVATPIDPVR